MAHRRIVLTSHERPAAPEQTNAESKYYQRQIDAQVPIRAALLDGRELRGRLLWFNPTSLGLQRPDGTLTVVGKLSLKYLSKDDSRPHNRAAPSTRGRRGGGGEP